MTPSALADEVRVLVGQLRRCVRGSGVGGDLTPSQASTLRRLDRDGPKTTSELARAEGMRPQSMGAIVNALRAEKLVVGTPDPRDRRQTILSVPLGQLRLDTDPSASQDWLRRAIETDLTAEERLLLAEGIRLLSRIANC